MEEEKAAAYYDELTRKGEGAARFKQGLGYSSSSTSDSFPSKSSTSASLFSSFVRASSPGKAAELEKQSVLDNIHNKLTKDRRRHSPSPPSDRDRGGCRSGDRDDRRSGVSRRRSSSRDRRRGRDRSHSPRHGHRSREKDGRRHRSRSPSREEEGRRGGHRDRDRDSHRRSSRRSRSRSPYRSARSGDRDRGGHEREKGSLQRQISKTKGGSTDYSKLIEGYSQMTPAERVKAKMKLQLSETAAKDTARGMNTGWERFDFNKDAPLDDDDDEIEVADDDASLVKDIGKSFRFSAVEAKREEEVKAAHDEAIFGASAASPVPEIGSTEDNDADDGNETHVNNALISDKVFAMQQGSWRDRARKFKNDTEN
ncbi:LOW QUALITY PROTEIN: uncharacterized protein [Elaeis guineensis]|uniref:LOW QUALITY PROTEIN: uncharacterized protein n=1 Tax=Elaeis guineensis var. tenera TaxID=51953 RepID=UPI003C6D9025